MNKIFFTLIFFCCQGFASHNLPFGIYLIKDTSLNAYQAIGIGLQNIIIEKRPLLSSKDFISYRCSDHSFELTEIGKNKLPEGKLRGLPFVFVAQNSKVYLGAFWSSFSSFSFGYPIIDTEWFKTTGKLKIDRAYPHDGFAIGNDPRGSFKILDEFRKHNILRDTCF